MNTARALTAAHAKCTPDKRPYICCRVAIKQRFLTMASTTYNIHVPYAVIIRGMREKMLTANAGGEYGMPATLTPGACPVKMFDGIPC
jgi:hypothetical protein